jgi:hypothetical protein
MTATFSVQVGWIPGHAMRGGKGCFTYHISIKLKEENSAPAFGPVCSSASDLPGLSLGSAGIN